MSGLVILFTVTIAVILPINVVDSKPSRALDDFILEFLNQHINRGHKGKDRYLDTSDSDYDSDSDSDTDSDSDDSDFMDLGRYGRLRPEDIIDLIDKAKRHKNKRKDDGITKKNRKKSYGNKIDGYDKSGIQTNILELFSKDLSKVDSKKKTLGARTKKRVMSNTLLPFKINDEAAAGENFNLENYSKVFIVLNPSSYSKSSNKDSLSDLVSKLLSKQTASTKKYSQIKNRQPRYKGFLVKDDLWSRRARRESKEMYAPKDSIEDDYKQKRSRNDRGGGGGGGGGRTAIPYIRHRGDIYEKDN